MPRSLPKAMNIAPAPLDCAMAGCSTLFALESSHYFCCFSIEDGIRSLMKFMMQLEEQLLTFMGMDLESKCMWFRLFCIAVEARSMQTIIVVRSPIL